MADQMKPDVVHGPKHNVGARNAVINDWAKKRLAKQREIDKAIETYVAPLKSDMSRLDKNVKTDTGMALKYLTGVFYKPLKLQQDAKDFLDEDERDKVLDELRAIFESMAAGGQLDFIGAIQAAATDEDDQASPAVLDKAFKAGRAAGEKGEDGKPPYPEGSESATAWMNGWTEAQTNAAMKMGGKSGKGEPKLQAVQ